MIKDNLNTYAISQGPGYEPFPLMDSHALHGDLRVYLREIKEALIGHIDEAEVVLGCVAWFTDFDILRALKSKRVVSIVIQKEDFLRPEDPKHTHFHRDLRAAYDALSTCDRWELPSLARALSTSADPSFDAVRCVGFGNEHGSIRPRMHHKFCVFGRYRPAKELPGYYKDQSDQNDWIDTYGAWTGSFNWTRNASQSLENAVYMADPIVVQNFTKEWANCFALSESLDWSSTYVEPDYRFGT